MTPLEHRSFGRRAHETRRRAPDDAAPSNAAIGGHPIHPMLVPFPIAFLTSVVGTDLAFLGTRDPFWARASHWLLRAGLASSTAAAVFGVVDFLSIERARRATIGKIHAAGNVSAMLLAFVNLTRRQGGGERAVDRQALILSASVAALLGITGWAGGELSFRHRVGVMPRGARQEPSRRLPPARRW